MRSRSGGRAALQYLRDRSLGSGTQVALAGSPDGSARQAEAGPMSSVLVPSPRGFEEIEAVTSWTCCAAPGIEVPHRGVAIGEVTGSHGIT